MYFILIGAKKGKTMNRRKFLKTAGMSLAVLAVINPLKLIPKRGVLPSKPLDVNKIEGPNFKLYPDGSCYFGQFERVIINSDGSFKIGDKDNYIEGFATGEIKIKGAQYAPA